LSKPQTVGGNIVKLNPTTGQYDTMYKGSTSQPASVQEYEYAKAAGYNGSFNDYQNEDANRKAIALGAGGLTTSQQNAAFKLSDDYRAESKDFFAQKSAYNRILSSAQDPSAAGDLALIFNYMKVLDPGSTVREGEFATAQNSGSIGERITAQYNKVMSGERLAPEQRADFVDRATKLFTGAQQGQKQIDDTYRNRAAQYGVPVDLILSDTSANNAPKTLDQYYKQNPADQPKVDQLIMENPDLSDDDILQILTGKSFNSAGNASASNRPQRNNNPLNIKASNTTRAYEGVSGTDPSPASDGGQFLTFNSPEAGFNAAKTLISSTIYSGLDIDSALRKWSGGGYGSEIVPELKGRQMATLTQAELDKLSGTYSPLISTSYFMDKIDEEYAIRLLSSLSLINLALVLPRTPHLLTSEYSPVVSKDNSATNLLMYLWSKRINPAGLTSTQLSQAFQHIYYTLRDSRGI